DISRTALYQIESGKTGLPRAGTLRRIAVALDVPMEDLLGTEGDTDSIHPVPERQGPSRHHRGSYGWVPSEGGPLTLPGAANFQGLSAAGSEEPRFAMDALLKSNPSSSESPFVREGELMAKLHDLLHSPFGDCVTRIIDELHGLLPRTRISG